MLHTTTTRHSARSIRVELLFERSLPNFLMGLVILTHMSTLHSLHEFDCFTGMHLHALLHTEVNTCACCCFAGLLAELEVGSTLGQVTTSTAAIVAVVAAIRPVSGLDPAPV